MAKELSHRISDGEGLQLAFELSSDDYNYVAHVLSSFANSEGGSMLFGVKANGKIKGVDPNTELESIEEICTNYCKPKLNYSSKVWKQGHHIVLEIIVSKSSYKVQSFGDDNKWEHFYRIGNQSIKVNKIVKRLWVLEKQQNNSDFGFNEEIEKVVEFVRENGKTTISSVYKKTFASKSEVDEIVSQLVFSKILEMNISNSGIVYSILKD